MNESLRGEVPFTEEVTGMSLDLLQKALEEKARELIQLGVTTPISELISEGVSVYGGVYDSVPVDGIRVSVGAGSLFAAVRQCHSELLGDELVEEKLLICTSNLAFGIEELYKKAGENPQFPPIFYPQAPEMFSSGSQTTETQHE